MIELSKSIFDETDMKEMKQKEKILDDLVWEAFDLPKPKA